MIRAIGFVFLIYNGGMGALFTYGVYAADSPLTSLERKVGIGWAGTFLVMAVLAGYMVVFA